MKEIVFFLFYFIVEQILHFFFSDQGSEDITIIRDGLAFISTVSMFDFQISNVYLRLNKLKPQNKQKETSEDLQLRAKVS